jgi:hypothetical protein
MAGGGRNGQPLFAETLRHVHMTLMKALMDLGAVIDGIRQPRRADRLAAGGDDGVSSEAE